MAVGMFLMGAFRVLVSTRPSSWAMRGLTLAVFALAVACMVRGVWLLFRLAASHDREVHGED